MINTSNILPKFMGLGSEARVRTTGEMWRRRADKPLVQRVGAAMIGFAMHSSTLRNGVNALLTRQIPNTGELIGNGYHQLVFAQGTTVTKVLVRTVSDEVSETADQAEALQQDSDVCRSYLGSSWLPTVFETLELENGKSVVVARQPFLRNGQEAHFFPMAGDVPNSAFRRDHADKLNELSSATGLYPDLAGPGNLACMVEVPIVHVDTMPLHANAPDVQASIREIKEVVDGWLVR